MPDVAVITGADRGLGLGLTKALLEAGWTVAAGRFLEWPELDELGARFPTALLQVPLDVGSDASVRAAAAFVADKLDHVDLLICNAAINHSHEVETIRQSPNIADMQAEFNVNSLGALRMVEAFLPLLDRGTWRRLCFVSSEAGSIGASERKGWFGYCMSKAALNMAVKNLSNDLTEQGYSFRLYHPGWLKTYMSGTKNLAANIEPEEGAAIALRYFLGPDDGPLSLHAFDGSEMPW